jgi:hypothetical protein
MAESKETATKDLGTTYTHILGRPETDIVGRPTGATQTVAKTRVEHIGPTAKRTRRLKTSRTL